jgi:nitrogen fixation NifU-like protein
MSGGDGALDQYWAFLKETYKQKYSEIAADHMVFPRNTGEIIDHNGFGITHDMNDNTMAIWLKIENDIIAGIAFTTEDCVTCTASGSMATEIIRGKTTSEALAITPEDIIEGLNGLPEEDEHCARLAADTIRMAVEDYLSSKQSN